MFSTLLKTIALPLALLASSVAQARIVDGSVLGGTSGGTFQQLTGGGFSVGRNNFNTNDLYAFDEQQGVTLTRPLRTSMGRIAAGTRVDSHYIFFDPRRTRTVLGEITFSGDILGVITRQRRLVRSSGLGLDNVTYHAPRWVGLERRRDYFIALDNVLTVDFRASSPGDHIRVITAAQPVPLPAPALMLLSGLGAMAAAKRRRKG